MNKSKNIDRLILIAKKELTTPYDIAHGINHHRRVCDNALEIIKQESLNIDLDLVTVACWWHDIEDRFGHTELLEAALKRYDFSKDFINDCTSAIEEHSFGKTQSTLLSKILYDADKLEYVSKERMEEVLRGKENGTISQKLLTKFHKQWHSRIKQVQSSLHFDHTKNIFLKNIERTRTSIKKLIE